MLATYFTLILAMFIVMVVGVVLGYSGNLENTIRNPLKDALSKYRDDVTEPTDPLYAYKKAWNEVQHEVYIEITIYVLFPQIFPVEMLWGGQCAGLGRN